MMIAAPSMARGACPALGKPMLTGDGFLSRIALTDAISPRQLAALCDLSIRHGNGILDISARGNLQVRGLSETSARALEDEVRALDLPLREGLAVEWSPLAGLDPTEITDPRPLGRAIIESARPFEGRLAPKLSVVMQTAGQVSLDHLLADIRLIAVEEVEKPAWLVTLGGTAGAGRQIGVVADNDALPLIEGLLSHLAACGPQSRGRDIRPGDLPAGISGLVRPAARQSVDGYSLSLGVLKLGDTQHALRVALPFGQIAASSLHRLLDDATTAGISAVRPAPDHTLVAFADAVPLADLAVRAGEIGLISGNGNPLASMDACAGRPACRSGLMETHALGHIAARLAPALFDGSVRVHLSGCAKGCAHPTPATLAFVGSDGATDLVFDGKTTDTPVKRLAPRTEAAAIAALSELMRQERQPGETSRDCLHRLGPARIAAAIA